MGECTLPSSVSDVWDYLAQRFGVGSDDLDGFVIVEQSGDYWLAPDGYKTEMGLETRGIRFVRELDTGFKPTTYGLQLLEDALEKNVVELDRDELEAVLDGELIDREADSPGYVALRFDGRVIGCGLYKNDTVSSWIPKGRGQQLLSSL